jgi:hypothetical protein
VEKHAPSTGEIRRMLQELLEGLRAMPVVKWLAEGHEHPSEIGEIVGLMLEVDVALMSEVDTFIGSAGQGGAAGNRASGPGGGTDSELLDLPPEEESEAAAAGIS